MSKKKKTFQVVCCGTPVVKTNDFLTALNSFLYHYLDGDEVSLYAREASE